MKDPNDVRVWRRTVRAKLLESRTRLSQDEQRRASALVCNQILAEFRETDGRQVGIYWPIRGEINLHALATGLRSAGSETSLPVITGRNERLAFARWTPETQMVPGVWNIPVPSDPEWVQPAVLMIPCVGFDRAGYRLGYGGGYYDRTLATNGTRPFTIGVGYEFGRLETIFPQDHDVPLDAVVTEASLMRTPPDD